MGNALKGETGTGCHPRVSGLGCWYGYRIRFGNQAWDLYLNLSTWTRFPTAETRDLKCLTQPPTANRQPLTDDTLYSSPNKRPRLAGVLF